MLRLTKYVAMLLLALWLPATLHCALESAGLISAGPMRVDGTNDHCAGDNCTQLEDSLFKHKVDELQAVAPDLVCCACCFCLQLPTVAAADEAFVARPDRPLNWVTAWHFTRRAAPSPRAPSLPPA